MTRRHARWLTLAMTGAAIGLAACGDDEADQAQTTPAPTANRPAADSGGGAEKIQITTQLTIPTGKVLDGSTIGDSPFCPGGTFRDEGTSTGNLKTFRCRGGRLTIDFSPGEPREDSSGGQNQRGPWKVVTGSGEFAGLRGGGQMTVRFTSSESDEARETFTGTVTR